MIATQKQKDAAFAKVYPELVELAKQYVPPFFQGQVTQALQSDQAKAKIHQVLNDAVQAAEDAG